DDSGGRHGALGLPARPERAQAGSQCGADARLQEREYGRPGAEPAAIRRRLHRSSDRGCDGDGRRGEFPDRLDAAECAARAAGGAESGRERERGAGGVGVDRDFGFRGGGEAAGTEAGEAEEIDSGDCGGSRAGEAGRITDHGAADGAVESFASADSRVPAEGGVDRRAAAGRGEIAAAGGGGGGVGLGAAPGAAVLSIHARVARTRPASWEHPSLVQLWGPRYSDYVVAAPDLAIFSVGRLPEDPRRRARAHDTAQRLHTFLDGRRMPFGQAGRG